MNTSLANNRRTRPTYGQWQPADLLVEIRRGKDWVEARGQRLRSDGILIATELHFGLNELIEFRVVVDGVHVIFHGRALTLRRANTSTCYELQLYGVARDRERSARWAQLLRTVG